jgi:hypothetical protein
MDYSKLKIENFKQTIHDCFTCKCYESCKNAILYEPEGVIKCINYGLLKNQLLENK